LDNNNDQAFWSGSDFAFWCLIDKNRTKKFRNSIVNTVKPGDVVVDAGTGTGIFALFAVEAGAEKVYAIEYDQNLMETLEKTFSQTPYNRKIELICGDASRFEPSEKLDVIICEMVSTGLVDEYQIPATNNLIKYLKSGGKLIPHKLKSFIDLVHNDSFFYNHKLEIVRYEYSWHPELISNVYSEKYTISEIDFSVKNSLDVDANFNIDIVKNGKINGVRISNETFFPDGSNFYSSEAYCMPLILPIDEYRVKIGDRFHLDISYKMCEGLKTLKYHLRKI